MEMAAGRRCQRRRDIADDLVELAFFADARDGVEQGPGVGMPRIGENLGGRGVFDHLAEIHDRDMVGQILDDAEVVGNEEIGEVALDLQFLEQVEDLRLDRDIERAGRLVEHQEFRFEDDGAGDGDALALATGEFVGIAVGDGGIEPDRQQHVGDFGVALGFAHLGMVEDQPFGDNVLDLEARR